jgi:hypothetical protein
MSEEMRETDGRDEFFLLRDFLLSSSHMAILPIGMPSIAGDGL